MKTELVWLTPDAEKQIAYMARVSNPANQENYDTAPKLLKYLMDNKHVSPFEMANACFEIETTRDIARQILRHRSFSFQEFSQRYAEVDMEPEYREARYQDTKNRQGSIELGSTDSLRDDWRYTQEDVWNHCVSIYKEALWQGVAKEVARAVLPEGLAPSRMYMNGTIRSWIHYIQVRTEAGTQKEHRLVAESIRDQLFEHLPSIKGLV